MMELQQEAVTSSKQLSDANSEKTKLDQQINDLRASMANKPDGTLIVDLKQQIEDLKRQLEERGRKKSKSSSKEKKKKDKTE